MNERLQNNLMICDTDIDSALRRLGGNESLYISCLGKFIKDPTMQQLCDAVLNENWNEAFTAAHALKGVAGNLGFIPLYHAIGELVILIRSGKVKDIDLSMQQVRRCYDDIMFALNDNSNDKG